ncbi:hypothetical protein SESBI_39751 [Sesbania bispinosa]|nr:hypothetical protein SESBI_39751 [Sesbania bispinosa]
MWHLLLAVALAGSTCFATKHFLLHHPNVSESKTTSLTQDRFRSRPNTPNKGLRVPNAKQSKCGRRRRLLFRLKKRKITINIAAKAPFYSSKDNSLFGWGLSFGIMFMMSAGKAEINKLTKTMDETAKLVQELKSEFNRRKSSCDHQVLDSAGNIDMNSHTMLKKTNNELRDTGVKIWSPAVNDCGECGSSVLTEEPEPQVLEMDQLEAELEFELQKLSGCIIDSPCHEDIKPKLDEFESPDEGCHGTDDQNFNYSQSHGVSAFELNQKLSHLLIRQQENQITELESELHQAQSKLHEKEAELQTLKDCVRGLTELSISTVSDEDPQALTDSKGTSDWSSNNMASESKQSIVGAKRPIDSESWSFLLLGRLRVSPLGWGQPCHSKLGYTEIFKVHPIRVRLEWKEALLAKSVVVRHY